MVKERRKMTMIDAVIARTDDLLKERKMSRRHFAREAGLSEGTIACLFSHLSKSVTLTTLKTICDGFGVTMIEFLDCDYFKDITPAPGKKAETE
ncbi:MAG: helix-turn-helix transcriptional regulator [Bacteroidales bacterium]|nr:helix-turn-helix transcriptional regulator [Bacteroidales bacterium]